MMNVCLRLTHKKKTDLLRGLLPMKSATRVLQSGFVLTLSGFILFLYSQQFKKALEQLARSRLWDVKPDVQAAKIRGYSGIRLQRLRREPAIEFGGQVMHQRIVTYRSLNPKPEPPIEVCNNTILFNSK